MLEQIITEQNIDTTTANASEINTYHSGPSMHSKPSKLKTAVLGLAAATYLLFAGLVGPGCGGGGSSGGVAQSTGAVTQVYAPNPPKRIDRLDTDPNDQKIKVGIVAPDSHPEYNASYQLELLEKDASNNYVPKTQVQVPIAPTTVNNVAYAAVYEFPGLTNGTKYRVRGFALNSSGQPSNYAPALDEQTAKVDSFLQYVARMINNAAYVAGKKNAEKQL